MSVSLGSELWLFPEEGLLLSLSSGEGPLIFSQHGKGITSLRSPLAQSASWRADAVVACAGDVSPRFAVAVIPFILGVLQ